jgi:hypothetical protein
MDYNEKNIVSLQEIRVLTLLSGGEMGLESQYKPQLMERIKTRFDEYGEVRFQHNDPNAPASQGIPDLTVFIGPYWSLLEVKRSEKSKKRPNQDWWIIHWMQVTFCSVIFPENEEEVLDALERSLEARGATRLSRS